MRVKDGKVTDEVVYLDASQEATEVIADAGEVLSDDGTFRDGVASALMDNMRPEQVDAKDVTLMDAAHKRILGSTAALVPFIEKNRIDRSLTGSRHATPGGAALDATKAPTVGTGIERPWRKIQAI